MEPDRGNPDLHVTREDIAAAAGRIGIVPGDIVFFHSSLSSMGTVDGGPNAVIDGFLDAVGADGTVAVPTLCNWRPGEQHLVFPNWSPLTTPSYVGSITEIFRKRPDAVRSDHATHSVAAIGRKAMELTANHGASGSRLGPYSPTAFAVESPWERLVRWNAAYCFIGVTFHVCTMVHYVETRLVERALGRVAPEVRDQLAEEVIAWMKPGVWPSIRIPDREVIEELLAAKGIVCYDTIGSATFRCARTGPMVDEWLRIVEADPVRWCAEAYVAWLKKGGGL